MSHATPSETYRCAAPFENGAIRKILAVDASLAPLAEQLTGAEVARIDDYGSISIRPAGARLENSAEPMRKVPAEAQSVDSDGVHVHFLLFVRDGWLCELQIYKDDGSPLQTTPSISDLEVLLLK
jgi:hypothetical protein